MVSLGILKQEETPRGSAWPMAPFMSTLHLCCMHQWIRALGKVEHFTTC